MYFHKNVQFDATKSKQTQSFTFDILNKADLDSVNEDIPRLMRYQLRGRQVKVYVESIGMEEKYRCERVSEDDAAAVFRSYGIDELRL